ncbi:DUF3429 domain-containing protein [Sulfitobacter sp.]|uniref:DUF3429 domain-containing protein n=1 Tax=Sulfitobacter sp. TaxID=1903071 RepID=UPI0030016904
MFGIPRAPLVLGLAGLLPFIAAAFASTLAHSNPLLTKVDSLEALLLYGTIILSFMSGVLWGFATKAEGTKATVGYILSVLPALWAFFMRGGAVADTLFYLAIGFIGLLVLDYFFYRNGLTPRWWMRLRIVLTVIVVTCLSIGAYQ